MPTNTEIRLRLLEHRVEQLAAQLLGITSNDLDASWPAHCEQVAELEALPVAEVRTAH